MSVVNRENGTLGHMEDRTVFSQKLVSGAAASGIPNAALKLPIPPLSFPNFFSRCSSAGSAFADDDERGPIVKMGLAGGIGGFAGVVDRRQHRAAERLRPADFLIAL